MPIHEKIFPQDNAAQKFLLLLQGSEKWPIAFLIFLIPFLLYANTIGHDYALDDDLYVVKNIFIQRGFSSFQNIWTKGTLFGFNGLNANYRPMALFSLMAERHFFGFNPHVNHFFNITFFALTCSFIYLLFLKIFKKIHYTIPLVMALLFAFHPIHTEVVANIKSRDEILGLLFGVISFYTLVIYISSLKFKHYLISVFCFLLAILSKENCITFVLIIPLILYFFTETGFKKILLLTLPYAGFLILYFIVRANILDGIEEMSVINNSLMAAKTMSDRYATNAVILGKYFYMLFIPYPLSWDYSYNQIPIVSFANSYTIASILIYLSIGIYILIRFKQKDILAFAMLFYLITIFLTSNLVFMIGSTFAERFLYTPSLGFCMAFPLILMKALKINLYEKTLANKRTFYLLIAIVLLSFSIILIPRNADWKNNYTLFSAGILTSPNSSRAYASLAAELRLQGEKASDPGKKYELYTSAIANFNKASDLYAGDENNWYNLGVLYDDLNNSQMALQMYERTLQIKPAHIQALHNSGAICYNHRNFKAAIPYFIKVLRLSPNNVEEMITLGDCYQIAGENDSAVSCYKKVLLIMPDHPTISRDLANLYSKIGDNFYHKNDYEKALDYYIKEISLNPNNSRTQQKIEHIYASQGRINKANDHKTQEKKID